MKIHRIIRSYDRVTEKLIGEAELVDMPLDLLRKIFHVEGDDPMYECYPVGQKELSEMQPYIRGALPMGGNLILDCDAVE